MALQYHVIVYETPFMGETRSELQRTHKIVAYSPAELARIVAENDTSFGSQILGMYVRDTAVPNKDRRKNLLKRSLETKL